MTENGNEKHTTIVRIDLIGNFDADQPSVFEVQLNQVSDKDEDNIAAILTALADVTGQVAEMGGIPIEEVCEAICRLAGVAVVLSRRES